MPVPTTVARHDVPPRKVTLETKGTTVRLNVRTGPGLRYPSKGTINVASQSPTLEYAPPTPVVVDGNTWTWIEREMLEGWVAGSLMTIKPVADAPPPPVAGDGLYIDLPEVRLTTSERDALADIFEALAVSLRKQIPQK
jgi:hypothetical protein